MLPKCWVRLAVFSPPMRRGKMSNGVLAAFVLCAKGGPAKREAMAIARLRRGGCARRALPLFVSGYVATP